MKQFDAFPDGVFTIPPSPDKPNLKVRAIYNCFNSKGVSPSELKPEEMER